MLVLLAAAGGVRGAAAPVDRGRARVSASGPGVTTLVTAAAPPPVAKRRSYGRYVGAKLLGALGEPVLRPGRQLLPVPGAARRPGPHPGPRPVPDRGAARERSGTPTGSTSRCREQFLTFLKNTFTGELGISLRYRVPVADLIADRLWPTLLLVGTSTLLATVIGVYLGIISGVEPRARRSTRSRPAAR